MFFNDSQLVAANDVRAAELEPELLRVALSPRSTSTERMRVALREYKDADGVSWRVWVVHPQATLAAGITAVPEDYRPGWLCFECDSEKRRLLPVPASWERRSDRELDILRRAATPVAK